MKITNLNVKAVIYLVTAFLLFGLYSCEEYTGLEPQGKDRYIDPPWLGGTSIETLQDTVGYTTFLALMERAKYTEPIERQLFTLFVPNDDAFSAYFQKIGKSGVDDLTEDEAVQLFTLHILPNARSAYQLKYEFYWNELQGPTGEYASLFYRKLTNSAGIPYKEYVKYNKTYKDREVTVYTPNKLLPLMSKDFFEDFFGALDGSDYLFLYPESNWGDNLNWHNAMVTEAEARTSSGFIYYVDKVVEPAPSIEEYMLKNLDKYSIYYDMAQRFALYDTPKRRKEDNSIMYLKNYNLISNIANEYGPNTSQPNYFKQNFTIYVPTNDAMQKYLDNTVLKYYESLDSVPEITLYYILQTHIAHSLALISKIENSFFNFFGDKTDLSRSDFVGGYMCSNGPFYTLNKVLEPNVFTCVPGRLFIDKNYSTFLYAMNAATLIPLLSEPEIDVTLFAVTNEKMLDANIRYNEIDDEIQTRGEDGVWIPMNIDDLVEFLNDHIYNGKLDDISGEGYVEMASKNYVHYKNGKIDGGKNTYLKETVGVVEKNINDRNGILYNVDKAIKTRYEFGEKLMDDPDLSEFANLLIEANFLNTQNIDPVTLDTIPNLRFISETDYWTAFLPTNAAVLQAKADGIIPTDPDELKKFLSYHFIRKDVIFDDGKKSGSFDSNDVFEVNPLGVIYKKLQITNSSSNLSVTDVTGQKISVKHADANTLVRFGVAHKITSVLKNK